MLNFYHFSIYWSSLLWTWIILSCLVAWLVIFDGIPNVNFMLLGAGFCCISLNSFICHITKWCVITGSFSNFPLRFGRMIANGMPSWLCGLHGLSMCATGDRSLYSLLWDLGIFGLLHSSNSFPTLIQFHLPWADHDIQARSQGLFCGHLELSSWNTLFSTPQFCKR